MFASGMVFVALLLVGTAALVTVPVKLAFGGVFDTQDVLAVGQAVFPQLGYVVLALYSLRAAGVMVAAATVSARRSGSFPRWLCRVGFVATGFVFLLGMSGGLAFFALPRGCWPSASTGFERDIGAPTGRALSPPRRDSQPHDRCRGPVPLRIRRSGAIGRIDATLRSRSCDFLVGSCLTSRLTNTPIRDPLRCTTWTGRHENALLSAIGGHSTTPAGRASNDS